MLRLLDQGGESHGYDLVQRLKGLGTHFSAGEGTVYPILSRFEAKGLVKSRWDMRRKYYRLTRKGRSELETHISRWVSLVDAMRSFLTQPLEAQT